MVEDSSYDQCSPKDRAEVLQFSLAALHYPLPKEALLSVIKVDADFEFGHSCRDAVWTLAFALNKTIEGMLHQVLHNLDAIDRSRPRFHCDSLKNDQTGDLDLYSGDGLKAIKKNLDGTNFDGLSVKYFSICDQL